MNNSKLLLISVLFAAFGVDTAFAQGFPFANRGKNEPDRHVAIHAGTLLAVPGEQPRRNVTIVVRNDEITAIENGLLPLTALGIDGDIELIDLSDSFVLPGLMDAHVHLSRATGAFGGSFDQQLADKPAVGAVNAMLNVRLTLAAGFTTVRDVGSDDKSVFAVRDAINAGKLLGPTVLVSGPIVKSTGGHGDRNALQDPDSRARAGVCDGADECRRVVRYLKKIGADLIKFSSTGGFSDQTGLEQEIFFDEMEAIVSAARQRGIKVTTHAYAADAVKDAVRAGVASIEHGYLLDDEAIRMMKKAGVYLVPTLTIANPPRIARMFMGNVEPPSVTMRNDVAAFERAHAAGVRIAFGTDAGIYPHGRNADEFLKMVELGMAPNDAIRAATLHTADLFGLPDKGSIEVGKHADIIAVKTSPLDDISALTDVDFVMKAGRVAKRDGEVTTALRYDLEHQY